MKLRLDPGLSTPIFEQIALGVESAIMSGELRSGDFLPSIRDLAVQLSVNPNTVAKGYTRLQSAGWVEAVRGTGLRVQKVTERTVSERRANLIDLKIDALLAEARDLGIPTNEIIKKLKARKGDHE